MPREYTNTGANPPIVGQTINNQLNGRGPAIYMPDQLQFRNAPMGTQYGGATTGASFPGVNTTNRTECVVIAALQGAPGAWTRYYFTHLDGGQWYPSNQLLFNQAIIDPANTWMLMNSNSWVGLESLFDQINGANPNGAIPGNNMLMYISKNDTFGLRFADGGIGQLTLAGY